MRIIAQVVSGNEADRYLTPCLDWLSTIVDDIHVYDDRSTDGSVQIARAISHVTVRDERRPSFDENEGLFRQDAWWAMERTLKPAEDDWVFAVDTDEFPVGLLGAFQDRDCLEVDIEDSHGHPVQHKIVEVFDRNDSGLWYRTDGFWGTITGKRLAPYRPAGHFEPVQRGGGSLPTYINGPAWQARQSVILHLGYARPSDREAKFGRYSAEAGIHASTHIKSIVTAPSLARWEGIIPDVL